MATSHKNQAPTNTTKERNYGGDFGHERQIFHFESFSKLIVYLTVKKEDVIITELLWSNLDRDACQHQDELVTSGLLTSRWGPDIGHTPLINGHHTSIICRQGIQLMFSLFSIAQIHGKMQHLGCYLTWKSLHEGLELEWACIAEIEKWQLAWEIVTCQSIELERKVIYGHTLVVFTK